MPLDFQDTAPTDTSGGGNLDPVQLAAWIKGAQQRVASGLPLDNSGQWGNGKFGKPLGYSVQGNQLVPDSQFWSSIGKGLLGVAGMATLGLLVGPLLAPAGPTLESSLNAGVNATTAGAGGAGVPGTIPTAFGSSAVDTTSSAAPGAAAGLPDWLKTAGDVGQALGAKGFGRAAGRIAEGTAQQNQARTADELYNSQLAAPGKIAGNSVRGDILSRAQDVAIAAPSDIPVPTISGGLRPSMFSPTTRATGATLTQNASQDAANLRPAVPPTLPDLQGANGLDTTLNTAGLVGSLAKSVPTNIWSKILGF